MEPERHVATPEALGITIVRHRCPCCLSTEQELLREGLRDVEDGIPGLYDIGRCKGCGLVFLSLGPDAVSLTNCYPKNYIVHTQRMTSWLKRWVFTLRTYLRFRGMIKALGGKPGSLIEFGCGDGQFLNYLESHWGSSCVLVGVDISLMGVECREGSQVRLIQGEVENVEPGRCFETAIMHQVLEHVVDPVHALKRLGTHLEPRAFLVGEVPDWASPWRSVFPQHWGGLQIPRHHSFFTEETLARTLAAGGFELVRTTRVFDPGDLGVSLCNWISEVLSLRTPPREAWFYFPVMFLSAPIVLLHLVIFRRSGCLGFVARKA
jgi:SAM-dependent methyltransferase